MKNGLTVQIAAVVGAVLLAGSPAHAEEGKVAVTCDVVLASNQGTVIDPPSLASMMDKFKQKGLSFSSFRRLSTAKLFLEKGKGAEVSLPAGRKATLVLEGMKEGTAQVSVSVEKLVKTTYALGRTGSLFINSGEHEGGQLVLVLSPAL